MRHTPVLDFFCFGLAAPGTRKASLLAQAQYATLLQPLKAPGTFSRPFSQRLHSDLCPFDAEPPKAASLPTGSGVAPSLRNLAASRAKLFLKRNHKALGSASSVSDEVALLRSVAGMPLPAQLLAYEWCTLLIVRAAEKACFSAACSHAMLASPRSSLQRPCGACAMASRCL